MQNVEIDRLVELAKVLSGPTRVKLLVYMQGRMWSTPSEVAEHLGIRPSVISHHYKIMEKVGLVVGNRTGKYMLYGVVGETLTEMKKLLDLLIRKETLDGKD